MTNIRFTRIDELSSGDIHELIRELEQACGIRAASFMALPLMHFLMQCLYPNGAASKRVPISTAHLPVAPLLDRTIDGSELQCGVMPTGGNLIE